MFIRCFGECLTPKAKPTIKFTEVPSIRLQREDSVTAAAGDKAGLGKDAAPELPSHLEHDPDQVVVAVTAVPRVTADMVAPSDVLKHSEAQHDSKAGQTSSGQASPSNSHAGSTAEKSSTPSKLLTAHAGPGSGTKPSTDKQSDAASANVAISNFNLEDGSAKDVEAACGEQGSAAYPAAPMSPAPSDWATQSICATPATPIPAMSAAPAVTPFSQQTPTSSCAASSMPQHATPASMDLPRSARTPPTHSSLPRAASANSASKATPTSRPTAQRAASAKASVAASGNNTVTGAPKGPRLILMSPKTLAQDIAATGKPEWFMQPPGSASRGSANKSQQGGGGNGSRRGQRAPEGCNTPPGSGRRQGSRAGHTAGSSSSYQVQGSFGVGTTYTSASSRMALNGGLSRSSQYSASSMDKMANVDFRPRWR